MSRLLNQTKVLQDESVVIIGHPSGLPRKYSASTAKFVGADDPEGGYQWAATITSFGGNSGSGVFSQVNGEMVGIHVSGGQDFSTGDNCYQIYVCSNSDIPLEDSATVSAAAGGDQTALMSLFTPCGGEFQEGTTVLSGPMLKLGASDGCERDSDCKNGAAIAPHR